MADDVTERLQHMNRTLQAENERAVASLGLLARSTRKLAETNAMYQAFSSVVSQSKTLMREVSNLDRDDRRKVQAAFVVLLGIVAYVFVKRAPVPAFVWPWNWIRLLLWLFRKPGHYRIDVDLPPDADRPL